MNKATSTGGTALAFDRAGEGPPVVFMSGSLDRAENVRLAAPLTTRFTVLNYYRRGHGDSGDVQPWAIECEVEDLKAVIARPAGRRPCSAVPATGSSRGTEHGSGLGRWRWVVERTFAWLHNYRRLRLRWERDPVVHMAFLTLACALICGNDRIATDRAPG